MTPDQKAVGGAHLGGLATVLPFRLPTGAIVAFAPDWRYTAVTEEAAAVLGTTPDALLGRSCWEVFPACADAPVGALMRAVMVTRLPGEIRTAAHGRSGSDIIARAVPTPDGGIRVIFRYVTRVDLAPRPAPPPRELTGTH